MAAISATDVTYTIVSNSKREDSKKEMVAKIEFGDGSLTYPAGGIPLMRGKMGVPTYLQSFTFIDEANADGFVYKFDKANEKIRIYQGDNDAVADGALVELDTSAAPAATAIIAEVVGW